MRTPTIVALSGGGSMGVCLSRWELMWPDGISRYDCRSSCSAAGLDEGVVGGIGGEYSARGAVDEAAQARMQQQTEGQCALLRRGILRNLSNCACMPRLTHAHS